MPQPHPSYRPTLDPELISEQLDRLLVPGPLADADLERRIDRLAERFRVYGLTVPHGLWRPGLILTDEMRRWAESYLPLSETGRAFRRLLALSLRSGQAELPPHFLAAPSWPDLLQALEPEVTTADPALLLRRLGDDGALRCRFLFALFLPRHHGGGFTRYPVQAAFLRERLTGTGGTVRCLDAACGSGEGTWELARLYAETGRSPETLTIHGSTAEPLELFAAAHGFFPHDPARQETYRQRIAPRFADGTAQRITFFREDLTGDGPWGGDGYRVILCNGLLGGPLLRDPALLEKVLGRLCARLGPGGMLLAADRFHEGWKKAVPGAHLQEMLAGHGLKLLDVGEGVGGVRQF
jgi:chemotaxis methyl-accepting protein methylase